MNAPAHARKLLSHRRTLRVTPRLTSAPLFPARVRNTRGGEAERRSGTSKFLTRPAEVSMQRTRAVVTSNRDPGCKCKRAELIEVVGEMGEIIEAQLFHVSAERAKMRSVDRASCTPPEILRLWSLRQFGHRIAAASTGIRRALKPARPLTWLDGALDDEVTTSRRR